MPMDPVGIAAVAVVLVVGVAGGLWRSRTSGRLRDVAAPPTGGAAVGGAVAGGAAVGGAAVGGVAVGTADPASTAAAGGLPLDPAVLAGLGIELGDSVTLLQFSSAVCAPCRAVSRISSEVAGEIDGVRHVEVDAEEHLDVVRTLGIWRTPTLLVLDRQGRVVKRATGVPQKPHLIAAVSETL
jgi:thiol-disulfide isomerase/thioredoxin